MRIMISKRNSGWEFFKSIYKIVFNENTQVAVPDKETLFVVAMAAYHFIIKKDFIKRLEKLSFSFTYWDNKSISDIFLRNNKMENLF